MSDLFAKIRMAFGDYAANKSVLRNADFAKLPWHVLEYLVTEFSFNYSSDWESRLRNFIRKHYFEVREREYVKSLLVEKRRVKIIDELRVWVDMTRGDYRGELQTLGEHGVRVPKLIALNYPMTMITGLWGLVELEWSPETAERDLDGNLFESPLIVTGFEPFQAPTSDRKILTEARGYFSLEEWLDVIINTIGYNHNVYRSLERKLNLITRLAPLAENNVNLVEFGPKATGKTSVFRNVGRYVRIMVGGNISPAALFYNLRTHEPGQIAVRDVIVFDEISRIKFVNPDEIIAKLKDYMESGYYERGEKAVSSECSIIMLGNVEVEKYGETYVPVEDLTYILPKSMRDSALIDRIHGLLSGWELPKIGQAARNLSQGYGIALDYYSEALHAMREEKLTAEISKVIELSPDTTIRDEKAVKKLTSALVKIIFPDLQYDNSELRLICDHAVKLRQLIRDWLHKLSPGEYSNTKLECTVKG